jgi:uncharacterized protein
MSRDFPDFIDPWKASEGQRVFHGTMPLKRMKRLSPLLASVEGEGSFELSFYFDQQRHAVIKVMARAELMLLCQRSLAPYTETVQRTSFLAVMRDISEQDMMPDNYEPVVSETGRLAVLDLVEDELLLALPQIPRNPAIAEIELSTGDDPGPLPGDEEEPRQRPFAGLAGMLEKD